MPIKEQAIVSGAENFKKAKTKRKATTNLDDKKVLDSKEEFFRLMAEKIKEEPSTNNDAKAEPKKDYSQQKSSSYKSMAWKFSFLALVLLVVVFYFAFVRLTVIIKADKETINDNLNFYAYTAEDQVNLERSLGAVIDKVDVNVSQTFLSTGETKVGAEIIGRVTIKNEYSKNQPLVATTRLLSSDDKLFRIKNTVNIPAGGSVEVEIYTDNPGEDMAIYPDRFTIPGLWAGLQDKIYAESQEKFILKQDLEKHVSQEDLDKAIEVLMDKIESDSQSKLADIKNKEILFNIDKSDLNIEIDNQVGEKSDNFTVAISGVVDVVSFSQGDVIEMIKNRLTILDFNKSSLEVDSASLKYELLSFNAGRSIAEIKVGFSAASFLDGDQGLINKSHLVNLNKSQIEAYLNNIKEVRSYDLVFYPSFMKRSSMLLNNINIEYK